MTDDTTEAQDATLQHVSSGKLFKPDPSAPKRKWLQPNIAEAEPVVIWDRQPNISQPFRMVNDAQPADFIPGTDYWLTGRAEDGNRVWRLRLIEVRRGGKDIVLDLNDIS